MSPRPLPFPAAVCSALLATVLLALHGASTPADASSSMHLSGDAPAQQGGVATFHLYGQPGKSGTAEFGARLDGVPGVAYSIQLGQPQGQGASAQWQAFGLSAVSGADDAAYLLLRHAQASPLSGPGPSSVQITALQLAIWEVSYDTTWNLANGNFRVDQADPAAVVLASTWLAEIPASPGDPFDVAAVRHYVFRDMVYVSLSTLAVIPEPGTAALVAIGLTGLLARRHHRTT